MYICIKGSGTYPFTLLSKWFLTAEKHQEKHKRINKDGAFRCGYSGDRLGWLFRWASSLFLNIFKEEAVTTSADRLTCADQASIDPFAVVMDVLAV